MGDRNGRGPTVEDGVGHIDAAIEALVAARNALQIWPDLMFAGEVGQEAHLLLAGATARIARAGHAVNAIQRRAAALDATLAAIDALPSTEDPR
ncbi:hypothetical protein GCM10027294_25360 [Marinactinospora endophytica]